MPRPILTRLMLAAVLAVATSGAALADGKVFATADGAIRGYDPVAYFNDGKPMKGSAEHTYEWNGVSWRFASAANRDVFAKEPETYAPKYGGYCAWAVSQGYTAEIDPDAWKIVDGALYLNYSAGVQKKWAQDIPGNIAAAESNWPEIERKLE